MPRKPRAAAVALDAAITALARRVGALASSKLTPARRDELAAVRRALATASLAARRIGPPDTRESAAGFVVDTETACDDAPDHGQDVDHDRGADAPEARRPR